MSSEDMAHKRHIGSIIDDSTNTLQRVCVVRLVTSLTLC